MPRQPRAPKPRYGVGELFGHSFANLTSPAIRELAAAPPKSLPCPFKALGGICHKAGGVCSLRLYRGEKGGMAIPVGEQLVTVCPSRFREASTIFSWIGEQILGQVAPRVITEVPFLLGATDLPEDDPDAVGQIDMVLLNDAVTPMAWCALEIQAVYFSGPGMTSQFSLFKAWAGSGIPFPDKVRRPDFRSSGPKRLMPQLQTKVPTLRRWGKKMAVVVDLPFWQSLGAMDRVGDMSNCDVAWFVVQYHRNGDRYVLAPHSIHLTTLERAVEGLTGGRPVSLAAFESAIQKKLGR